MQRRVEDPGGETIAMSEMGRQSLIARPDDDSQEFIVTKGQDLPALQRNRAITGSFTVGAQIPWPADVVAHHAIRSASLGGAGNQGRNSQIIDAVTQTNVKVVGEDPAKAQSEQAQNADGSEPCAEQRPEADRSRKAER